MKSSILTSNSLGKIDESSPNPTGDIPADDYESVSRGSEQGEVGGSDWEELIDLLQPRTPIKEVKGRLTKSKLEEHVNKIIKPKVIKTIKIKDL